MWYDLKPIAPPIRAVKEEVVSPRAKRPYPRTTEQEDKKCPSCGETLPVTEFRKHHAKKTIHGFPVYYGVCRACIKDKRTTERRTAGIKVQARGKEFKEKKCTRCNETKPIADFPKSYTQTRIGLPVYRGECKTCHNKLTKAARERKKHASRGPSDS